ncbi:MAG: hypothetical protein J1F07_02120 [Muribaculaceae bacterium]|nr:hypothetical protein [Muribaculaceae bacterium]
MRIGNRRAEFINYRKPGIFMITMNKLRGIPDFGIVRPKSGTNTDSPIIHTAFSTMGACVFTALSNLSLLAPHLKRMRAVIMPDHIHFLVRIMAEMEQPLGYHMAVFKREALRIAIDRNLLPAGTKSMFQTGFNDQFLRHSRSLDVLYNYIDSNPDRLWSRIKNPNFFSRITNAKILGEECSLYGNLGLLQNPFIYPVIVHRSDVGKTLEDKLAFWRYGMANGGVLVGAFIADMEGKIFKGAAGYGGKLILISRRQLDPRQKPSGILYRLCERGQLLIIMPKITFSRPADGSLSRGECLFMNHFAERMAAAVTQGELSYLR